MCIIQVRQTLKKSLMPRGLNDDPRYLLAELQEHVENNQIYSLSGNATSVTGIKKNIVGILPGIFSPNRDDF